MEWAYIYMYIRNRRGRCKKISLYERKTIKRFIVTVKRTWENQHGNMPQRTQ